MAIFGTTISPYLFFWQSAQEVEEVDQKRGPASAAGSAAPGARRRSRASAIDTIAGMLVSNLIALAIMIATAATLHQAGVTNIQTAAEAAKALEPIAGHFAFAAVRHRHHRHRPAGHSGAGGIGGLCGGAKRAGWKTGLDNMPWQARGFYTVIGAAVLLGLGID